MWRSHVPVVSRRQTVEIDSPVAQAVGEIGGSGPQSVGAQSALCALPEPGPGVVLGLLEPHAINRPNQAIAMNFVMQGQRSPVLQLTAWRSPSRHAELRA
jgi:hypothetical protein